MGWYEYDSENGYEYFEPPWYYAVGVGHNPGIYTKHEDAVEQVHGFPGFRMRKFDDYEDARNYLEEFDIYCDSETEEEGESDAEGEESDDWFYAVAVGRSTGIYLNFNDAWKQIYGYPRSRMDQFRDYDEAEIFIYKNQMLFEEEEEKSEEPELKIKLWFYAVAVGRSTGVYVNSTEALEQVHGFSGFKMKKFRSYDEAEEYVTFNQVYSSDEEGDDDEEESYYAVAVGRCVGMYMDWEEAKNQVHGYSGFRMKKFLDYDEALTYIKENRACYSDEEEEKTDEPDEAWYYAVAVGRNPGIYRDHQDALDQVHGYSGFRLKKFLSYDEAQEYIWLNEVYCSDEETSDEDDGEPEEEEDTWYYAVAVGRSPGIYTAHEHAMEQVHGYSGFRMKKFLDWDEAQEYIDFHQVYSSDEEYSSEEEPEEESDVW